MYFLEDEKWRQPEKVDNKEGNAAYRENEDSHHSLEKMGDNVSHTIRQTNDKGEAPHIIRTNQKCIIGERRNTFNEKKKKNDKNGNKEGEKMKKDENIKLIQKKEKNLGIYNTDREENTNVGVDVDKRVSGEIECDSFGNKSKKKKNTERKMMIETKSGPLLKVSNLEKDKFHFGNQRSFSQNIREEYGNVNQKEICIKEDKEGGKKEDIEEKRNKKEEIAMGNRFTVNFDTCTTSFSASHHFADQVCSIFTYIYISNILPILTCFFLLLSSFSFIQFSFHHWEKNLGEKKSKAYPCASTKPKYIFYIVFIINFFQLSGLISPHNVESVLTVQEDIIETYRFSNKFLQVIYCFYIHLFSFLYYFPSFQFNFF